MTSIYDQILYENEIQYYEKEQKILEQILKNQKEDLSFYEKSIKDPNEYLTFYQKLKQFSYHENYEIINRFLDFDQLLTGSISPVIKKVQKVENRICIEKYNGKKYYVTDAKEYFKQNEKIKNFIKNTKLLGHCFEDAQFLSMVCQNFDMVVSLRPNYFVGNFYHAYNYDPEKDVVIDLAYQIVMKKEEYDELFETKEVLRLSLIEMLNVMKEGSFYLSQPKERPDLLKVALYIESCQKGEKYAKGK